MHKRFRLAACLTLTLFSAALFAEPLPIEYFVKDGDYLDVALSPSGKRLAARVQVEGATALVVIDRGTNKVVGGVRPRSGEVVHSYHWISDERFLFSYAEKQFGIDHPVPTGELLVSNYDGKRTKLLAGYRASDQRIGSRLGSRESDRSSFYLVDTLDTNDRQVLVVEYPWSQEGRFWVDNGVKLPIVHRLDIRTGKKIRVEVLPFHRGRPLTAKDGSVRFVTYAKEDGRWSAAYRETADAQWQEVAEAFELDRDMTAVGITDDGNAVFLRGANGPEGYYTIFRFDLVEKSLTPLFEDIDADIVDFKSDPKTGEIVVGRTMRGMPKYHYAPGESDFADLHRVLIRAFAGRVVTVLNSTGEATEHMVRITSDVDPGQYYIFNSETKKADFFWANMSWIDPKALRPMLVDAVEADDGFSIPVRLTLPEGDVPAPLVVHPHGGPHGAYDPWQFNREVQLLANRGYAVLQVNFRGSGGFGARFERAGYTEWGGKMIDDIAKATRWAMQHSGIDGERLCAYGGSYGAYAAYMLAVREPDLLRCTAGYVGVYDLSMMFTKGDIPRGWGGLGYLQRVLGTDEGEHAEFSPVNHAETIKASTLLIHGDQDRRVPIKQGRAMRDALRAAGHEPGWVRLTNSGHGAGSLENRRILYESLLAFLHRNLKAQGTAVATNE